MPTKSIFRQPGARHFQLVHRSQRDPLIHDPDANQHVLKPIERSNTKKGKSRAELEASLSPEELAHDLSRSNIGEAAAYGVYYDDTEYDYMQHLRHAGVQEDGVDIILVEAPTKPRGKKGTKSLAEDMLRDIPQEALPSRSELPRAYDAQGAIPAELQGLQPDMDPHLRQALEALEDDAFVDDAVEDDFFLDLVGSGERGAGDLDFEFDEDGEEGESVGGEERGDAAREGDGWEGRFEQFMKEKQKGAVNDAATSDVGSDYPSEGADTVGQLPALAVIGGKRRRKGMSDASGYSMSSSSMFRNEGLTMLDERFDQVEKEYASDEEEDEEEPSADSDDDAPPLITSREDFNAIMDDFLEKYEILGGKMRPVLPGETNAEKLGAVRRALREDSNASIREKDLDGAEYEDDDLVVTDEKQDRWDCETILTTYSNLENHPRIIRARNIKPTPKIILDPKTGLPTAQPAPMKKPPDIPEDDIRSTPRGTVARRKDETREEKKARKQVVKEERQARRVERKANKEQFASEKAHQIKALANKEKQSARKL